MLELDTTIMTLSDVLVTSGHVAKFADWMCKDVKTAEIFRADHLVEGVLEARSVHSVVSVSPPPDSDSTILALLSSLARLKGDKEARGIAAAPVVEMTEAEKKKNKNKKKVASTAVKLEDDMVKEIEFVLAQVRSRRLAYTPQSMRGHS